MMKSEVPPHLRPGTLREWLRVLKREGRRATLRGKLRLAWTILKAALRVGGVSKVERDRRLTVCSQCIIYDPTLRRCKPYDGAVWGCGCYSAWLVLQDVPYPPKRGCWAKQAMPDSGLGWE